MLRAQPKIEMCQPLSVRVSKSPTKSVSDTALLMRARRMATRSRTEKACRPCKAKKSKCSDSRPCASCCKSDPGACMQNYDKKSFFEAGLEPMIETLDHSRVSATTNIDSDSAAIFVLTQETINIPESRTQVESLTNKSFSIIHCFDNRVDFIAGNATSQTSFAGTSVLGQSSFLSSAADQSSQLKTEIRKEELRPAQSDSGIDGSSNIDAKQQEWVWEAADGPGKEDPFKDDGNFWISNKMPSDDLESCLPV